jgi:hypothetical protein
MIEPIHLRAAGVVALLLFVAIFVSIYFVNAIMGAPKARMIEIELPLDVGEVSKSIGDPAAGEGKKLLANLALDSILFIPSYTLLFLVLSWLLSQRSLPRASWLGVAAGACTFATAALDYLENAKMISLLRTPSGGGLSQAMLDATRHTSLAKWSLSFVTSALLSLLFLWRPDRFVLVGVAQALASLAGLLACLAGLTGWLYRPAITYTFGLVMVGNFAAAVVFVFFPSAFLRQF